jgi:hypothetical protein
MQIIRELSDIGRRPNHLINIHSPEVRKKNADKKEKKRTY